jgi:diguanylate cyclase (GGDEF)-like protein
MNPRQSQPPCVLAIDDSTDVLALLGVRLKPEGIHLETATSYDEGLAKAMNLQPDLILLDVDMPEHSGLDLCRRLKAEGATAAIPVIFLTGSSDVETKVHGFDLGAVDYVTKPFHPAELRARVRAALRMKRAQDLLTHKAQIDALTGLRNRSYLDERLAVELLQCVHLQRPLSLVLLDLDHFKALNDGYGHPFGDLVLQRIGDTLTRTLRPCDAACRYGGEELALILPNTSLDDAALIAERVRVQIRSLGLAPRGQPLVVTASFGVAEALEVMSRGPDTSARALIQAADQALYRAKREGRDCVRLDGGPTMTSKSPPVLRLISDELARRAS